MVYIQYTAMVLFLKALINQRSQGRIEQVPLSFLKKEAPGISFC